MIIWVSKLSPAGSVAAVLRARSKAMPSRAVPALLWWQWGEALQFSWLTPTQGPSGSSLLPRQEQSLLFPEDVPHLLTCSGVSWLKCLHCISKKLYDYVHAHLFLQTLSNRKKSCYNMKAAIKFCANCLSIRYQRLLLEYKLDSECCSVPSFLAVKRQHTLSPPS